ncbi:MAG: hypothetical protein PHQ12_08045 [Chthoniobacteraceae bacterium]|nr:hypothetical protein [Chthoniobacteraceae bacterium]
MNHIKLGRCLVAFAAVLLILCNQTVAQNQNLQWPLGNPAARKSCHFVQQEMWLEYSRVFEFRYDNNRVLKVWLEGYGDMSGIMWGEDIGKPGALSIKRGSQEALDLLDIANSEISRLWKEIRSTDKIDKTKQDDLVALMGFSIVLLHKPPPWPFERETGKMY